MTLEHYSTLRYVYQCSSPVPEFPGLIYAWSGRIRPASTTSTIPISLKLLSINALGLNHPAKRFSLWEETTKSKNDIIIVQETHFKASAAPKFQHKYFSFIFSAQFSSKKRGVLIAVKNSVDFKLHSSVLDDGDRYVILVCTINNKVYTIVGVYAPNYNQGNFFCKLVKYIAKEKQGNLIVCGDINSVVDPFLDSTSNRKHLPSPLPNLMMHEDIYATWRCLHTSERDYTYHSPRFNCYSSIDLCIVDKWLLQRISSSEIADITWSDNAAISITISDSEFPSPALLWRCNNKLIKEQTMNNVLTQWLRDYFLVNDTPQNRYLLPMECT